MSRNVKRVPLDFDHPIDEAWPGYLGHCDDDECDGDCPECLVVDPPNGEGWQLWEDTSEGSPMSPVFATGEELVAWMASEPCGFAGSHISEAAARKFVFGPGWAPSMVFDGRELKDGITAGLDLN